MLDGEAVHLDLPEVRLFFSDAEGAEAGGEGPREQGSGRLLVTSSGVVWLNASDLTKGFRIGFSSIALHAVSRDPTAFPFPCIYCQLDEDFETTDGGAMDSADGAGGADEDEGALAGIMEARFVPGADDALEAMYTAFSACAALNPSDDEDEDEEDAAGGGGGVFFSRSDADMAAANMAHYDSLLGDVDLPPMPCLPTAAMEAMVSDTPLHTAVSGSSKINSITLPGEARASCIAYARRVKRAVWLCLGCA